jgi:hypothetical protein
MGINIDISELIGEDKGKEKDQETIDEESKNDGDDGSEDEESAKEEEALKILGKIKVTRRDYEYLPHIDHHINAGSKDYNPLKIKPKAPNTRLESKSPVKELS